MAGLNLVEIQDIITAHIRAEFPGYDVREDDIIDSEVLARESNKVKPYVVLNWGGLSRSTINTSFAGVRHDEYSSSVDVSVVAPTPKQCRKAVNVIQDKLVGWKPTGGGALTPEGVAGIFVVPDYDARPHLYVGYFRLGFTVNGENVGEYITP